VGVLWTRHAVQPRPPSGDGLECLAERSGACKRPPKKILFFLAKHVQNFHLLARSIEGAKCPQLGGPAKQSSISLRNQYSCAVILRKLPQGTKKTTLKCDILGNRVTWRQTLQGAKSVLRNRLKVVQRVEKCKDKKFAITDIQYNAIQFILTGRDDTQVADALQIDRSTIWRWKTSDPAYRFALETLRESVRAALSDHCKNQVHNASGALYTLMTDSRDEKIRLRAAEVLFRHGRRYFTRNKLPKV
jgi:hypothetical protein